MSSFAFADVATKNPIIQDEGVTKGAARTTNYVGDGITATVSSGVATVTVADHAAITLATDADTLLGLSTQQLTLDSQNANVIFAGPVSGAAADPTFRALVDADIPNDITITETDPLALLTAGTDNVKDTHIDWGTGAGQVSADDVPDGSTNAIITLTQETNFGTAYTHSQDNTQAHSDYLLNSESDIMTGTLTADGLTLGTNEYLTIGTETLTFDAITSNDFELSDDLNINDTDPHLKLVPAIGDAFETYAYGNEWYFTNVTDSKVLWKATTGNLINFYNQTGYNFPDSTPADNQIFKYDAALGRFALEADATGAGYTIYIEEGDVAKADNTAADLYVDFDATDFETAVVGNEVNVTIPDDGHAHTTTSISGLDISADTNLAGDTEIVLTGDALSIASTITRDTELSVYAPLASPTFTGTVTIPTPFTLGAVSVLPTGTELNFVDGVTSAIQTQLNTKATVAEANTILSSQVFN